MDSCDGVVTVGSLVACSWHGSPRRRSCWRSEQILNPDQVVHRGGEGEDPADQFHPAMVQLAKPADRLAPAEAFLDQFPLSLTHRVARMARRPPIDRAPRADSARRAG